MKHTAVLLLSLLCILTLSAIETGKPMPAVQAAKWYSQSVELPPEGLAGVVLLDITSGDAVNTLRMLESLKAETPRLVLAAVAVNAVKTVDAVVQDNGSFQIPLAADHNLRSRMLFAETESLFPYAVLAKDGKVVWTGHPMEMESVIKQIDGGTFSISKQRHIEAIRQELQMAVQSGLPDVITAAADKILKLSPADRIAIQAKLFALSNKGEHAKAASFLEEIRKKNPMDVRFCLMQLDFLLNRGDMKAYKETATKAFKEFVSGTEPVLLAAFVLDNSPYGIMNPALMRQHAEQAYLSAKDGRMPFAAICRETLARICADTGDPARAVALQQEALALRKGTAFESAARDRLEYYKQLLALSAGK